MQSDFLIKLKKRLKEQLPGKDIQLKMAPSFRNDFHNNENIESAGVLLLLYPYQNSWFTVLMKRAEYPGVHSGQISFPGGKFDKIDKDLSSTALRETEEEFGVPSKEITLLGKLTPLYIPVSKIKVYPFTGYLNERPIFKPDSTEVQYLLEIAIYDLLDPRIIKTRIYKDDKYEGTIPYYFIKDHEIWGATAMILCEFIEILKDL